MSAPSDAEIAAIRGFNRFYTRAIGLLGRYLGGSWSLTEARVLYELFTRDGLTARDLGAELGLDAGYLSRILARFERDGLLSRQAAADDGRRRFSSSRARAAPPSRPMTRPRGRRWPGCSRASRLATANGLSAPWGRCRG